MVNTTYSGVDKQGRPFSINADRVSSAADADGCSAIDPTGRPDVAEDGTKLTVVAESGTYDRAGNSVDLQRHVTLQARAGL